LFKGPPSQPFPKGEGVKEKRMNSSDSITQAEKKYLTLLESFFMQKWGETKLWSHDLSHHRRVWSYAKELLQYKDISDPLFVEKLLITCYLHDAGMAINPGSNHGQSSRKLCKEFLVKKKMNLSDYPDVLEAIGNHDNKEYADSPSENKLLLLLSVADDLDAFGYTGIYRYLEIYLVRGINPENIGPSVLKNTALRFNNFKNNFKNYPELVKKHQSRYIVLIDFFENLNSELSESDHC
jgi:HD superfamily phosphodiesterase